ncbi:MAG: phosphatidylglycerol lysyltransferase domain-containing protein, partial [Candidatus Saccharimonadales bacterium]
HMLTRALVPLVVVGLLLLFEKEFVVKSDIQGFGWAVRFSLLILALALVYGIAGFILLDRLDFHQEISLPTAAHYTVDQLDLTTTRPLHPYTKRARLFVDSLSFVSVASLTYAAVSLFQPLRLRWSDQSHNRQIMAELLATYGAPSEDFFKLWPHDKYYFFDKQQRSGLAYRVHHGVALCLGDPAGPVSRYGSLLKDFNDLCYSNSWLPALIHVQAAQRHLYEKQGFTLQKIGQEAVLDIKRFQTQTSAKKYFRQIRSKFARQGFSCELLHAPHHPSILDRLRFISNDWLSQGGRVERGFVMGYYRDEYLQQCSVMVARDAAGTIQAFITQVPADFDRQEATFDMLRHTSNSPGNTNDYLLMHFIDYLDGAGYERLNLGLCPLAGLTETDSENGGLVDGILRFAYANGDRFYSFSGLHRFKAKYEPDWRDRFIAYRGGVRGFSRTTTALMRSMRVKPRS